MLSELPVLGICGWSGCGKTTLIEAVLPLLIERNLRVAVAKYDMHCIDVDRPGKDSDRFFRAGADVYLQGDEEFIRLHLDSGRDLQTRLKSLARQYDLILVEGHKWAPLSKVWLLHEGETQPPPTINGIKAVLPRNEGRVEKFMDFLIDWLSTQWLKIPVSGCVVAKGPNDRTVKLERRGRKEESAFPEKAGRELEKVVQDIVFPGTGEATEGTENHIHLPSAVHAGDALAGLLAAMRWNSSMSWLVVDIAAHITAEALQWLLSMRSPGVWAILPRVDEGEDIRPFPAYFDFRFQGLLESFLENKSSDINLLSHGKIITPRPPAHLCDVWQG